MRDFSEGPAGLYICLIIIILILGYFVLDALENAEPIEQAVKQETDKDILREATK